MDSFLAGIPFWVYAVVLVVTFVLMHAMFFIQRTEVKNRALLFVGRIGSSFILLAGLLIVQPEMPATILAALALAALAGLVSGRSAPPLKPRPAANTAEAPESTIIEAESADGESASTDSVDPAQNQPEDRV